MLVHRYELFQLEQNKTIPSMFTHFIDFLNGLKCLDKTYTNSDLVRKVLRSLLRSWELKVTAIQGAKDLNSCPLDELLGSLMTHKLIMQQKSDEENNKKKTIAPKATTSALSKEDSKNFDHKEGEDSDMILLARKFRKFLKKKDPPIRGKKYFRNLLDRVKEKEKDRE